MFTGNAAGRLVVWIFLTNTTTNFTYIHQAYKYIFSNSDGYFEYETHVSQKAGISNIIYSSRHSGKVFKPAESNFRPYYQLQ